MRRVELVVIMMAPPSYVRAPYIPGAEDTNPLNGAFASGFAGLDDGRASKNRERLGESDAPE